MSKRRSPMMVIGWTLQILLTIVVATIGVLIFLEGSEGRSESLPETEDRLESPYGIPDYNVAPEYENAPEEHEESFIEDVPETIINYDKGFAVHYGQNAKAICTTLDNSGLKVGDIFPSPDEGSGQFAYVAVNNYCPHNL